MINGKEELSEIVTQYRDAEEGYVTAWIEDTDDGVFLYLQKELSVDDETQLASDAAVI
jgi:hypothetical protein